jgi:hypothetical protein
MSERRPDARVAQFLDAAMAVDGLQKDADVAALLDALRARFGEQICAVLLYGSYLRGAKDTLLDFYVVVDDYGLALDSRLQALSAFLMPPNVYYLSLVVGQREVRAKYAVVSRRQLQRQVQSIHPYFWARFTQPCRLIYARDAAARTQLVTILAAAVDTFVRRVAPMLEGRFSAAEFWNRGFSLTYRAELRAEQKARVASIFEHDMDFYVGLLRCCEDGQYLRSATDSAGGHEYWVHPPDVMPLARWYWGWTIGLGKLLSVARLVKAAVTFNDPIDYILWKIERHSGVRVEASERQRRYPLIFAWPLAWRLFRLGAFR